MKGVRYAACKVARHCDSSTLLSLLLLPLSNCIFYAAPMNVGGAASAKSSMFVDEGFGPDVRPPAVMLSLDAMAQHIYTPNSY